MQLINKQIGNLIKGLALDNTDESVFQRTQLPRNAASNLGFLVEGPVYGLNH